MWRNAPPIEKFSSPVTLTVDLSARKLFVSYPRTTGNTFHQFGNFYHLGYFALMGPNGSDGQLIASFRFRNRAPLQGSHNNKTKIEALGRPQTPARLLLGIFQHCLYAAKAKKILQKFLYPHRNFGSAPNS